MRVAVIGVGAMGSLYGALLSEAGNDVTLVDVWKEHVETVNRDGLRLTGVSGDRVVKVRAITNASTMGTMDLVIIFVKSYHTEAAVQASKPLMGPATFYLTLQNGLGSVAAISRVVGVGRVIAGTTAHGSTMVCPGEIIHAGAGLTVIGGLSPKSSEAIHRIRRVFNDAGIETELSGDVESLIWGKVFVNLGINALTALTGLRNGQLLEVPELKTLMRNAVQEGQTVAEALGVDTGSVDHVAHVYRVAEATGGNKSSMLQDVERGRRTEIDALNGAVTRLGEEKGVDTPVNSALTALVKGLEHASRVR
ncbi:2-dehydropantoate 2-reductase [Candidatus Bathyarchaeota archaeon]|nr:2-dehydropantoate 2-reductase [Candidatus Bathyarchaeota archaeon]